MKTINICDELHQNFINFAYEANSERAFPDARDGLKPGQRACLWEMYSKGYFSSKPHVKSAKISGGTIADYWPHSSDAIYETFGRMSQPWVNNIPEVDWHGSNGNIVIGQALASDRYTEARLSKVTEEGMFYGIKKNNVDMIPNFSEDKEWPSVLPAILPRLLVNGCQGIGVTLANTWIPMNFKEVFCVIKEYLETGAVNTNSYLIDFPTGGTIVNKDALHTIHETGKGKVVLRGTAEIKKNKICITELPYQIYVEPFIDSIKELINKGEFQNIKEIHNKTDKSQMLIEIDCEANPQAVLQDLYSKTALQSTYNANQWALISKTPTLLNLSKYIKVYVEHNLNCITREKEFDRKKAIDRKEIVDGLLKALEDIDNVIQIIKTSESAAKASENLIKKYEFSVAQATAIINMKLGRLANLEKIELTKEAKELNLELKEIEELLSSDKAKQELFLDRLSTLVSKYGDERRTKLTQIETDAKGKIKEKPVIPSEDCIILYSIDGEIKRVSSSKFKTQRRNGKGNRTKSQIQTIIRTNTTNHLLVFTNLGKMYKILVNDIDDADKFISLYNYINFEPNEKPITIYSLYENTDAKYILFTTKSGMVKKTALSEFSNVKRKNGIAAIKLKENDSIVSINLIKDENIILCSRKMMAIKFSSTSIAPTGRVTAGVKGISLKDDDYIVSTLVERKPEENIAIFTTDGNGKQITNTSILAQTRAGKGIMIGKDKELAAAVYIDEADDILIAGNSHTICISASDIPIVSKTSIGNQMIKDKILSVSKIT